MIKLSRLIVLTTLLTFSVPAAWADDAPASAASAASEAAAPAPAADAAAPAAADAAPAAPTEPTLVGTDKISSGDTAWMLTSVALVLMMTIPGLALFYGGMVRKKNVLATLMQSFAITCVITILWWLIGYSWAFTPGSPYLGGATRALFNGMTIMKDANKLTVSHLAVTIPETVYAMFQLTFAIITPALIAGAFADRMKFSAMLVFMSVWSLIVYSPIAHWVWEPTGWLAAKGVLDYAGGTVVHINAGIAGLASCLVLGKRVGYGKEAMPPHNLVLTLIGASLLWVGWFGFNAGSAVAADGRAGMAMAATQIATAAAALGWMFAEWLTKGKPSVLGIASGAVAGPRRHHSGFGLRRSDLSRDHRRHCRRCLLLRGNLAEERTGIRRFIGRLRRTRNRRHHRRPAHGVFASKEISGADGSVMTQLWGVGTTVIYGFVVSFIILKVIDLTIGLRVTEEQEREGLDISLHGEKVE